MGNEKFPIPVVRLIVCDEEGRVLLLRRANSAHASGAWCLPGGKVDYGEEVLEAARRELTEETGLVPSQLNFLFYQDSLPPKDGEMHCINLYLECRATGELSLNEESSEFTWVDKGSLKQYDLAFGLDQGLWRYWGEQLS